MNKLHLSIGSNIENRLEHIESAYQKIKSELGSITHYSKIYQSPSWGFSSTPFLNSCIILETDKTTEQVLDILQSIEQQIGRKPKKGNTYESRPIDLDIIYSSEAIFETTRLTIPHPLMQERKFVLIPLIDIIDEHLKHPILNKTTTELLANCNDDSKIELFSEYNS